MQTLTWVIDVLTISKLDSGLFAMTPVEVQLISTVKNAVKMFEGEAASAGVDLKFAIDDSCAQMHADLVSLDPTRLLQILINLLTNAIKFTRLETKKLRRILVSLSVSVDEPKYEGNVSFAGRSRDAAATTLLSDWQHGNIVSLYSSHCMDIRIDHGRYTSLSPSRTQVEV